MSTDNKNKVKLGRRDFLKISATAVSVAAVGMTVGCGSNDDNDSKPSATTPKVALPTKSAWKFGIISDTQWTKDDDGENPASAAVDIINSVNDEFVKHGVSFVVAVGDLTDDAKKNFTAKHIPTGETINYTPEDGFGVRARYVQKLYNNGIGFFPLRGNHDDSAAAATQFLKFFPQTKTGEQNNQSVQSAAYSAKNPDTTWLPEIARTNTTAFKMGTGFSSPTGTSSDMTGLSYSFDYNNARFVLLDNFTAEDGLKHDTTSDLGSGIANPIQEQQSWITSRLSGRAENTHAFCFAHKGLLTQDHVDVLFGLQFGTPGDISTISAPGIDDYIKSLADNGVRWHINGHDHMHDRSIVYPTDGSTDKSVMQLVCVSDSSKFYTPGDGAKSIASRLGIDPNTVVSNDGFMWGGKRQKNIAQELYSIGYYIFTVDGPLVTVDFYASPAYSNDSITTTPTLNFTKRETFAYSLNGQSFLIEQGGSLTSVESTAPNGTVAKIIDGKNGNLQQETVSGRKFNLYVNTGWLEAQSSLSDVFYLNGMAYNMGSEQTDAFTLSMSYDSSKITEAEIKGGKFGIATNDESGIWINAVNQNFGGGNTFVQRAWNKDDKLGTWGVDTTSKTVWAVLNYNGFFAVAKGMA